MAASDSRDVLARIDTEKESYLEELKDYIRIPSISTDPDFKDEVLRASDFLVGKMREAGLQAERIDTAGHHPLVYAEWLGAPGKPTVLFYGHYDVQPVDPIELWRNPPFEPTVEGDKLVARGATDDKGQSYAHLKGVAALLAERGRLPVNVKFLVEGEEEAGGEAIDAYVKQDGGKRLAADCVVISDSSLFAPGQPSLIYGLKGLCYMEIKVTGPNRDLHSGTYGGAVWNPLNALCHIVDGLRDAETGKILIPGFYDDVRPLEAWEREEFGKLPWDEDAYRTRARRSRAVRRGGVHHARAHLGAADLRRQRHLRRLHGEGGEDRAPLLGRRQGVDAPGSRSGLEEDRRAVHRARPVDRAGRGHRRGDPSPRRRRRSSWRSRARSSTPPSTPWRRSGARGRCGSARGARSPSSRPSRRSSSARSCCSASG